LIKATRVALAADGMKAGWLERRNRTVIHNVPDDFRSAYEEFTSAWAQVTDQCRKLWIVKDEHGNDRVTDDIGKDEHGNDRPTDEVFEAFFSASPIAHLPQPQQQFDPSNDDAFACIENAMFYLSSMKDDDDGMQKAVHAWEFLTDPHAVCLLTPGFAERWREVPHLVVSGVARDVDKRKAWCFWAYEEAVRVFALGYYGAALILSRSALDRAPVSLYGASPNDDLEYKINNSAHLDDALKSKAHDIRLGGNRIAHVGKVPEWAKLGQRDGAIEQEIVKHFQCLKEIVESASEPHHRHS